jgi:DNA segregation ATPase FtsK/SpoIIIE-like protein
VLSRLQPARRRGRFLGDDDAADERTAPAGVSSSLPTHQPRTIRPPLRPYPVEPPPGAPVAGLAAVLVVFVLAAFTVDPLALIGLPVAVAALAVWWLRRVSVAEEEQARNEARDQQSLAGFIRALDERRKQELRRARTDVPDLAELGGRARTISDLLWSRRTSDANFLRLGLGYADRLSHPKKWPHDLFPEHQRLVEAARLLPTVPVPIDLAYEQHIAISGAPEPALALARGLLVQAATMHSPAQVAIGLLTHAAAVERWDWLKWLPHLRAPSDGTHTIDADADARPLILLIDMTGLLPAAVTEVARSLHRLPGHVRSITLTEHLELAREVFPAAVVVDASGSGSWERADGSQPITYASGLDLATARSIARDLAVVTDPTVQEQPAPWDVGLQTYTLLGSLPTHHDPTGLLLVGSVPLGQTA